MLDSPTTLPPQTMTNIGDLLSAKGVTWAWYAVAWQATLDGQNAAPVPNLQYHHQPFNYFADLAPGTAHLRTTIAEGQALMRALHGRTSGLCQPSYVLDIPDGYGKSPIGPSYLSEDGAAVEDFNGRRHIYPPG